MKKLIVIMLVAMIPFITMAQKRSKKDKKAKQEVKIPTVNFMVIRGVSFFKGDATDMMQDMTDQNHESVRKKIRISFDFGSKPNKGVHKLMEKSRGLYSMTDAVNMLSQEGWEFVSANIVQQGSVTTYYYYMQRK